MHELHRDGCVVIVLINVSVCIDLEHSARMLVHADTRHGPSLAVITIVAGVTKLRALRHNNQVLLLHVSEFLKTRTLCKARQHRESYLLASSPLANG